MIEEGFDINTQSGFGWTALCWTCYWGHIEMVKLLVSKGADINAQNHDLKTALYYVCAWGHIDIAKLLIENGADVTARDKHGNTPFDELKGKHPQQYEELIEWLTENHPEKALEHIAHEKIQDGGLRL